MNIAAKAIVRRFYGFSSVLPGCDGLGCFEYEVIKIPSFFLLKFLRPRAISCLSTSFIDMFCFGMLNFLIFVIVVKWLWFRWLTTWVVRQVVVGNQLPGVSRRAYSSLMLRFFSSSLPSGIPSGPR